MLRKRMVPCYDIFNTRVDDGFILSKYFLLWHLNVNSKQHVNSPELSSCGLEK